jgi:hypothetical protein
MTSAAHTIESTSADFVEEARLLINRDDQAGAARDDQQRELHMAAAEALASAYQMDPKRWTQRAMAEAVGKAVGWVNTLIGWRANGYVTPTAFGPASKARKEKRSGQPEQKHESRDERLTKVREQEETKREKIRADFARAEARAEQAKAKAKAEEEKTKREHSRERSRREKAKASNPFQRGGFVGLTDKDRERLIKFLEMLSSDFDGEIINAGRMANELCKKIGVGWDKLIVRAGS